MCSGKRRRILNVGCSNKGRSERLPIFCLKKAVRQDHEGGGSGLVLKTRCFGACSDLV